MLVERSPRRKRFSRRRRAPFARVDAVDLIAVEKCQDGAAARAPQRRHRRIHRQLVAEQHAGIDLLREEDLALRRQIEAEHAGLVAFIDDLAQKRQRDGADIVARLNERRDPEELAADAIPAPRAVLLDQAVATQQLQQPVAGAGRELQRDRELLERGVSTLGKESEHFDDALHGAEALA